jgi:DnaK suppressor protein
MAKGKKPAAKIIKISKPVKSESKAEPKVKAIVPPKHLSQEMLQIRGRLVLMLSDMRKDIEHEVRGASDRDVAHINDTSDMATDAAEGDLALRIAESETVEASEIERAIEKVDNGTYGICEICNKAIGVDRLQFLPYVTMCIKCQELAEIRKREEGDELDDLAEGSDDSENN